MNIATALLLAYNLISAGKPAQVVDVGHGKAVVVMVGRPGCYAKPSGKNFNDPIVVCDAKATHK